MSLHLRNLCLHPVFPPVTSADTWLLQEIAPAEALPFYSDIIWDCMELLAPRLDIEQREAFCKVRCPHFVDSETCTYLNMHSSYHQACQLLPTQLCLGSNLFHALQWQCQHGPCLWSGP